MLQAAGERTSPSIVKPSSLSEHGDGTAREEGARDTAATSGSLSSPTVQLLEADADTDPWDRCEGLLQQRQDHHEVWEGN